MKMPNFLIIGAAKSGTTSLYYYLKQHPQVYMSPLKETNFFALEGQKLEYCVSGTQEVFLDSITSVEDYTAQFQGVLTETAIGEASPLYLYSSTAAERVKHYLPNANLIVVLRNPVERAYSNFLHLVRDDLEPLDNFALALQQEEIRVRDNWWWGWHYVNVGFYYAQLKRYLDRFECHQIKIYLYEDLQADLKSTLSSIFQFLCIDATFVPDTSIRYNATGMPKSKALHTFLMRPNPVKSVLKPLLPANIRQRITVNTINRVSQKNLHKPQLPSDLRRQLIQVYEQDILMLQDTIQRDLSRWLV